MPSIRSSGRHKAHFDFDAFERRHEDLKAARLCVEPIMRDVANYVATSDDIDPIERGGKQLPRNRVDATARVNIHRLGAVLNGYLFSPFSPFFKARLEDRDMSAEEQRWATQVDRIMHAKLTGPRAPFRLSMGMAVFQAAAYGYGPVWVSRKGRRLVSTAMSVWDSWLAEDPETQLVDTLHWRYRLPAWRAAQKFSNSQKLQEKAAKEPHVTVTLFKAVRANEGGMVGARQMAKPFREETIWLEGKEVLAEAGYDEFPGATMRFERKINSPYGDAPGRTIAPWAKLINAREDNAVQAEEQNINPTLLDFSNGALDPHDLRPGAQVPVDASNFSMMARGGKVMERLYEEIRLTDSRERVADLRNQIALACYVDWMQPGEGKYSTATFINDKRDLRMRAMSTIVAGMEYDFNQLGDRYFSLMDRMGLIPEPPESLNGETLVFDFVSPLAIAQERGQIEQVMAWLQLAASAVGFDEEAGRVVKAGEVVRDGARRLNIAEGMVATPAEIAAWRRENEEAEARAEDAELGQAAASMLRDAGQGAASLVQAGGVPPA